ncbi:hypothetical protein FLAG1_07743 [Fusarium langsethiae]|uniref:Uncharacterized protein n=1 Tax=Fusarium langsethiae TaxID=179993 RepID=A0A0M9ETM3_FUSLA|nr:hypothetical protein FLAG1_07743 [Fusarium langsethiae]GKU22731.1 unnamed protein product [Fusarium langsethiae]
MCHIKYRDSKCPVCSEVKGLEVQIEKQECDAKDKKKCAKTKETKYDEITCGPCVQDQQDDDEGGYGYGSTKY